MPNTASNRRRVATPATIQTAAGDAAVAEISRALIDRVYGVSQAELAEVLEIQARQATDKVRLEMLQAKLLQAHTSAAPVQPGPLTLLAEHKRVSASVSWKGIVEDTLGKEFAAATLATAQAAARLAVGELVVRVVSAQAAGK